MSEDPAEREEAVCFESGGQQVRGMLHLPAGGSEPVPGVLIVHGFTGNHIASFRKFVTLARALAVAPDLIIADESHRSIYNRYRDLFRWFDGYQVGLTATPLHFVFRNTYSLFSGCVRRR